MKSNFGRFWAFRYGCLEVVSKVYFTKYSFKILFSVLTFIFLYMHLTLSLIVLLSFVVCVGRVRKYKERYLWTLQRPSASFRKHFSILATEEIKIKTSFLFSCPWLRHGTILSKLTATNVRDLCVPKCDVLNWTSAQIVRQ